MCTNSKMNLGRLLVCGLAVASLGVLSACKSDGGSPTAELHSTAASKSVIAWETRGVPAAVITMPNPDSDVVVLTSGSSADICAGCKAAATEYFRTGNLPPTCPVCHRKLTATSLAP